MSWFSKKIIVESAQGIIEGDITSIDEEENGTYVNFKWNNEQWAGQGSVLVVEDPEDREGKGYGHTR